MLIVNKLRASGWRGAATLMLSLVVIAITLGASLLLVLAYVVSVALASPSTGAGGRYWVVPGVRLENDEASEEFKSRLARVLKLMKGRELDNFPQVCVLGGVTAGNRLSEAEVGAAYLHNHGVPKHRILQESLSRNTLENFRHMKAIVPLSEKITVVTSRYHLARCRVVANAMGYGCQLCAAEDVFVVSPGNLLKMLLEAFNLHWFFCRRYCGN